MRYNEGACFPLPGPFGCRVQPALVKLDKLDESVPQYLQVYLDFSLPSYNLCFPLPGPFGCLVQPALVNEDTLDAFVPQYSQ